MFYDFVCNLLFNYFMGCISNTAHTNGEKKHEKNESKQQNDNEGKSNKDKKVQEGDKIKNIKQDENKNISSNTKQPNKQPKIIQPLIPVKQQQPPQQEIFIQPPHLVDPTITKSSNNNDKQINNNQVEKAKPQVVDGKIQTPKSPNRIPPSNKNIPQDKDEKKVKDDNTTLKPPIIIKPLNSFLESSGKIENDEIKRMFAEITQESQDEDCDFTFFIKKTPEIKVQI